MRTGVAEIAAEENGGVVQQMRSLFFLGFKLAEEVVEAADKKV